MIERLSSYIKKELAFFLEKNLPIAEGGFVSVTKVFINERADKAEVFVSVFPENLSAEVFVELKFLQKDVRRFLSSRIKRHKIPDIKFILDKNLDAESLPRNFSKIGNRGIPKNSSRQQGHSRLFKRTGLDERWSNYSSKRILSGD